MKKLAMAGCAAVALCAANAEVGPVVSTDGVTLTVNRIQQRYPWNGLVDIDYTIACVDGANLGADDNLEVLMVDRSVTPAVTNRAIRFLQAPLPLTVGAHRITWDANADGVTNRTTEAEFHVKIVHYSEAYMVIDVSGGSTATVYPVDYLNGVPANGFNAVGDNEYKGNKIVLRRIHTGSYMAGSPTTELGRDGQLENQHRVAFSKPFYIGVFQITQKQYENVMGVHHSAHSGDYRPVETVGWEDIRGVEANWPANTNVTSDSFVGKLIAKCKAKDPKTGEYSVDVMGFDIPTDFQWEYACRAGTLGALNSTNSYVNTKQWREDQLKLLGQYKDNGSATAVVGSFLPNAWGLYDMHGNVWEWCRDYHVIYVEKLEQYVDPVGPFSASDTVFRRVLRGGSYTSESQYCRSAYRGNAGQKWAGGGDVGFRLSRTLP